MARDDWFRRTTWSPEDERAFHERLRRSRTAFHKAQYARIQALHLAEAGLYEPAIGLLRLVLTEYPERTQLASTHLQVAGCRLARKEVDAALDAYRASLRAERAVPGFRTEVWIEFPWLVATRGMTHLYDEAREFLAWGRPDPGSCELPVHRYRRCAVEAFMAEDEGDREAARVAARAALEASRVEHSGMRYHPTVGLVGKQERKIRRRLARLAR